MRSLMTSQSLPRWKNLEANWTLVVFVLLASIVIISSSFSKSIQKSLLALTNPLMKTVALIASNPFNVDPVDELSGFFPFEFKFVESKSLPMSDDQNGMDGSYLECYMKENDGVAAEDAQTHVAHLISNAWERLDQETLITLSPFPPSFTKFCLNAPRMVLPMYSYRRNESLLSLQEYVKSLLRVDEATYEHIHIPSNPKGHIFS